MPDTRSHRGMHPEDAVLFGADAVPRLKLASEELSWLLSRGYAPDSSLKLVGDRHALKQRQRAAVGRSSCAAERAASRRARMLSRSELRGAKLLIDGFNVLTTLEVALSFGIVLVGRDGALRDIAGMHGSYRNVEETLPALGLVAALASACGVASCTWFLDRPVSNSGRLCTAIERVAREQGWCFEATLVPDADKVLEHAEGVIASADGQVLDRCERWFNLARACVQAYMPNARLVDLSGDA